MSTAENVIRLPKVKKALDTVTGAVLIGFGAKVLTETRQHHFETFTRYKILDEN